MTTVLKKYEEDIFIMRINVTRCLIPRTLGRVADLYNLFP
jgi:hypothetical protein